MPGLDRTGPMGQGSQTGRKQGKCTQEDKSSVEELPRGRGFGRGFRNWFGLWNEQNTEPGLDRRMGRGRGSRMGRGRR